MKRKIIGIALLCALCLTLLPAALLIPVRAADGGDFGGSFHWSFADGTLTVTGSGAMEEYLGEDLPWSAHMSEIETVKIGEGITLLGGGAFDGCRTLKKAVLPKSLLEIGAYAFRSCGLLSDINFPSKLQKIGTQAFTSCGSLPKTVKLPDSITDMGTGVFTGCPFTSFTLPLGMDYVSAELLYGCSALSEVKLHDGVRTIKARAFSLCTGLTEFHFPKNISLVGDEAFYKCTGLREIRVPAGVYSLEGGVFSGCTGLTSVVLEEGITSLNYGVFAECTGLKEITLPDSLGSVGYYTFLDCKNLERLTLSSGTAFVHAEALYGCSNLKEIAVPASNPYLSAYDGVLYKGDKLIKAPCALAKERVAVKPGTVAIGDQAFEGCAGIREITLPDSLRTIGYAAFNGCSKLGSVTIPDGVTTIQQSSFTDCSSLKSVSLPGSLTQIERGAFGGGLTSAVLRGTHDEILSMIIGAGNEGLIRAYINGGNAPYHTCAVQPVTDGNSYYWRIAFYNEPMGPLPIPEKQGYRFEGWYTARNGAGERVTEDTVLTLDVSLPLYANWVRARTIGVVACGGKNRGPEYYRITEAEGWALGELPAEPERPGWRFLGWYTAAQGGERVEPGRVFEADCYIYAHWERTQYAETVSDGAELTMMRLERPYDTLSSRMTLKQSRARWPEKAKEYLFYRDDGGFTIVKYVDSTLLITEYNARGKLTGTRSLEPELPIFGGFCAGERYYYVVSGQMNYEERDDTEVVRITWYDKSWNRVDHFPVRNCITFAPFEAGTVSMAEHGSDLIVTTTRQRYKSADGKRHQSNLFIDLDVDAKRIKNDISEFATHLVSHSIDQIARAGEESYFMLEKSDGNPKRAILVTRFEYETGEGRRVYLMEIPGGSGANATGVNAGGLEITDYGMVALINTVDHSLVTGYDNYDLSGIVNDERDVMVLANAWDNHTLGGRVQLRLTDYVGKRLCAGRPYLVKLGPDRLCALWEEFNLSGQSNGVCYVLLDGTGTPLTENRLLKDAKLSASCQPQVRNGTIVWYEDEPEGRTLYKLKPKEELGSAGKTVRVYRPDNCITLCYAWYDENGRQLGMNVVPGTESGCYEIVPPEGVKKITVFRLRWNFAPLSEKQELFIP